MAGAAEPDGADGRGRRRRWVGAARPGRRAPWVLVGFLVLVGGLFAAAYLVDRHRLATPTGAVRAWLAAGAAGDCERYLDLETAGARGADLAAGVPGAFQAVPAEVTSASERVCRTLVQRFGTLSLPSVVLAADGASVQLAGPAGTVAVPVLEVGGRWKVDDARLRTCSLGPADPLATLPRC